MVSSLVGIVDRRRVGAARVPLACAELQQPDDWLTFNTRSMPGIALSGQKKHVEAEPLLLAEYDRLKKQ